MKISLAIPSHDNVPVLFAYDLASLCAYTVGGLPDDVPFGINLCSGTYIHAARNELMQGLLRAGADYILWLDSDMRFPRESLSRLLRHDLDVVGINYAKRGVPSDFVAIKKVGVPGEKLETLEESEGLEEVEAMGFGMVLMKTSCLAKLPDPNEVPWFQNKHLGGGQWMGEDVHFCDLLRSTGVRLFVDHDLSKECRHIGLFEYACAHAAAERQEAA